MVSLLSQKRVAEFFAGIGLMRMGLEQSGWDVVFANDIDPRKHEMYRTQFQNDHFILGDVYDLNAQHVPDVTLATASFPCVDLSLAGPMNGLKGRLEQDRQQGSGAFWGFIQVIKDMGERRPPFILLENVPSFITSHKGQDLEVALQSLNDLGYLVDAFIVDAALFVPQSRKRLFVVGVQQSLLDTPAEIMPIRHSASSLRPKNLVDFIWKHPNIHWNIRALPEPQQQIVQLSDIVEDVPHDSSLWWSRDRVERLLSQMSPRHLQQAEAMIADSKWSYGTVFRRTREVTVPQELAHETVAVKTKKAMAELRTDGIAGCLRTPKGGSAKQILFKAGYQQCYVRLLTGSEVARLMGADNYKLTVTGDQVLFGFGDAVCVPVIEWVGTHYFNALIAEINQKSAHP